MHNSRLSLWPSEHARGVLSRAIASRGGQSAVLDFAKITSDLSLSRIDENLKLYNVRDIMDKVMVDENG